jgi:N-acetylmuramate 1-kinase
MSDLRLRELSRWSLPLLGSRGIHPASDFLLTPASDDASFRRYFRSPGEPAYIFVDAPAALEDSRPFVRVAGLLGDAGLNVPRVLASDLDAGFMMQTDLGTTSYFHVLGGDETEVARLYAVALDALITMQMIPAGGKGVDAAASLADYDEDLLNTEMALFTEWFLERELGLAGYDAGMLQEVFSMLAENALAQPQVFVHRDYHCRNLMATPDAPPGILDFQDAVIGPVTYDLVSLLKDCYHRFPRPWVETRVASFHGRLQASGRVTGVDDRGFLKWFDLMGAQRHLKCAGIFSRLNRRDGKPGYLGDIPLVIDYLLETGRSYPCLAEFTRWLERDICPRLADRRFKRP